MRWVLTGGGNPYALNLARHLLINGHEVHGIGRSALKGEAFTLGADELGYKYHVYSIGPDTEFILDKIREIRPDIIVNFAAQGEGQVSFDARNWKYFFRTNTQHLVELTERLANAGLMERFIQVGTSELYGSVESAADELSPIRPTSPYAASKAAFDLHLLSIAKTCKFPALIVRPSNCVCEGQQLHRIIPKTLIYGMTGRKVPLQGGGVARKSYLHADDLSRAIEILATKGNLGEVYNVGPLEPTSIRRLLDLCAQCLGKQPEQIYELAPDRAGQDSCYWLLSDKMRSLGWEPQVPLMGAVSRMHGWLQQYPELTMMDTSVRIRA